MEAITNNETLKTNLEKANIFAKENSFILPPNFLEGTEVFQISTCCIDGRRPKNENGDHPMCAIPGADEGIIENILAALNALNIPVEKKEEAIRIYIALKGGLQNINFHTDEGKENKNAEEKTEINIAEGCGHFRLSVEDPKAYGLKEEDVKFITELLTEANSKGCKREILAGSHKESLIMLIDEEDLGLKHQNTEGQQAFVYNRALHAKILDILASEIAPKIGVDEQELKIALLKTNEIQLTETVKKLAKGLEMFSVKKGVNATEKELEVKLEGEVK